MNATELAANIQYTVDQQGHIMAVVVQPVLWQRIISALEHVEDPILVKALQRRKEHFPNETIAIIDDAGMPQVMNSSQSLYDSAFATMLASEKVLANDWTSAEEDAAWADL